MRLAVQRSGAGGLAVGAAGGIAAGAVGALAATTSRGAAAGVVVAAAALTGIAVAGNLRRVLLCVLVLDIPFQWDKFFGWRPDVAKLAALGGFSVSVTTLALVGLYALWLANLLAGRARLSSQAWRAARVPAALLLVYVASLVWAKDRTVAGFEVWLLLEMLLLFVYVAQTVRDAADVRFLLGALLVALLIEALLALAGYAAGGFHVPGSGTAPTVVQQGSVGSRLVGTLSAPNTAGAFFGFGLAIAIATLTAPVGPRLRRLAAAAAVPAVVCLALSLSRGAWVGIVVSVVVIAAGATGRRASRLSPRILGAIGVATIVLLIPLQSTLSGRVNSGDNGAAASRVPLVEIAAHVIEDHPLLGVGANNLAIVLPAYAGPPYSADWLAVVHNKLLLVWSEAGLGALLLFLAFLAGAMRRGWRARRSRDPLVAALALGLTAGIAGHIVHMNFDTFKGRPLTELLWLSAGLLASRPFIGEEAE